MKPVLLLAGAVLCAIIGIPPARAAGPTDPTLDQIDRLVRSRFYSTDVLDRVRWPTLVARTRAQLTQGKHTPAEREATLHELLAALHTSHTEYLPRSQPEYWELASIFQDVFPVVPEQCPKDKLPPLPITRDDIGVLWKRIDGHWFLLGILPKGPADQAGLLAGDEVVAIAGRPTDPVGALAGTAGQKVVLTIRRHPQGPTMDVTVVPRQMQPVAAFREALRASARVIERGAARIGYLRVWSWTGDEMSAELRGAIGELNRQKLTGFILDIRDGWGGAPPWDLAIFNRHIPVLESRDRKGNVLRLDSQIRVPAMLLINGGSRSGKEVIAFGAKKHGLARLVGEKTAGAVLPGTPFCLDDGALLYLAVASNTVDGESLEGRGVLPDVVVPFDIRHAAGRDPQLEAAIGELAGAGAPH
jgi:carboxyl-terminal processing protease